ncbi:MAG TPA: glycosyltransferase family 4 protein [Longimicrobiales bacterium]
MAFTPMRIAMVSTPFLAVPPKDYGGTELVVHELAEGLIERGHDVTLFTTGDSHTAAELRSLYPQAQWPPDMLTDLNHVSWAIALAVERAFDIIHAHSAVALAMGRLVRDVPLVYTLHHERDEKLSAFYRHFRDAWYIAISEDQRSREIQLPRLDVIHHGLSHDRYEWTERPDAYVAYVGRLTRVKGPHTAIDAAARAGVEIRVAGDIHEVDRAFGEREIMPRLALPHVHYLGLVGMSAKVPLLRAARALLAPVEWNEPFGLILIEAMLSGCPVVGYPRGSLPELVESGVTGFLAATEAELVELIRPGGVLDAFDRRRCRERAVERFSRDRMVSNHERLYRRIVLETAGARRRPALIA